MKNVLFILLISLNCLIPQGVQATTLVGWAEMPRLTLSDGPTSNQFNNIAHSITDKQFVQGFSAVIASDKQDIFYFLTDNGFGKKTNSADALLRIYEVNIQFNQPNNKPQKVKPLHFLTLSDPHKKLSFPIQADFSHYYNQTQNPEVDAQIVQKRLLTGADIDPESMRLDREGHLWIGDEFGPFLIKLNQTGEVLQSEMSLAGVKSADHPFLNGEIPNLRTSAGFEGLAVSPNGEKLYPILQSTIKGDVKKTLRIYEFDTVSGKYTDHFYRYQLDDLGRNVNDFIAVNDHEFLVLEQNWKNKRNPTPFAKVYLIDINEVPIGGVVKKTEIVDLMDIADPHDLNQDEKKKFSFEFPLIETLLILDKSTILVANDNDFKDVTQFIKVHLDKPLPLAHISKSNLNTSEWQRYEASWQADFGDRSLYGWLTTLAYFIVFFRAAYLAYTAKLNIESPAFWLSIAMLLLLLGLNKELDLQTNITQYFRGLAREQGWYADRRYFQKMFIFGIMLMTPVFLFLLRYQIKQAWKHYKLVLLGLVFLFVFVFIRAASFHHVDTVLNHTIGRMRYYQGLELIALMVMLLGSYMCKPIAKIKKVKLSPNQVLGQCPECGETSVNQVADNRVLKCKQCGCKYKTIT